MDVGERVAATGEARCNFAAAFEVLRDRKAAKSARYVSEALGQGARQGEERIRAARWPRTTRTTSG
ncbi:hypothetical protein QJS66_21015 [Kocuria rhizophila]|nr:hypothetical protein QJS66_21015 [Kocuria rhizophila]